MVSKQDPKNSESGLKSALVIGANGGIGSAVLSAFEAEQSLDQIFAVSRSAHNSETKGVRQTRWLQSDASEESIQKVCKHIAQYEPELQYIVIATGVLHDQETGLAPEKRLEQLGRSSLTQTFDTNAILPLLWLKHLSPLLNKQSRTRIAVLSARVGSISDNQLGGWYSYRASKAALNMLLKTLAIEFRRKFPGIKLISFHPGTTDTALSEPFQNNVPEGKLFEPSFVASRLVELLKKSETDGELGYLDWDHKPIQW